jgi:hypothetical protein
MNTLLIGNSRATRALKRISILTLLSFLFVGCFAPAIVAEKNHKCQLVTKKRTLTLSEEGTGILLFGIAKGLEGCGKVQRDVAGAVCGLILLGIVAAPVASLIVSGSIVVVGNTIHWVEKQGRCENSVTQTFVRNLISSVKAIGGKTIQSTTDLITWFKQLFNKSWISEPRNPLEKSDFSKRFEGKAITDSILLRGAIREVTFFSQCPLTF